MEKQLRKQLETLNKWTLTVFLINIFLVLNHKCEQYPKISGCGCKWCYLYKILILIVQADLATDSQWTDFKQNDVHVAII